MPAPEQAKAPADLISAQVSLPAATPTSPPTSPPPRPQTWSLAAKRRRPRPYLVPRKYP